MKWEWKETQVEAETEEGSHQAKPSYLDSPNRKNKIHDSQNNHLWIFFLRLSKELISGGSGGVFMICGEHQGHHASLELVTNQIMKAHDGGVVAILLYRVNGVAASNILRVYCMVAHPLKPHLVATEINVRIIFSEFDSRSLIHITPLLMSVESGDHYAICILQDELRLLNLDLSNTTDPSHGKLYGDSFEPLCVTRTKKWVNAPVSHDAYSIMSVSNSRKYVAVVWPDIPYFSIDKVINWSIIDLGSARILAWDTYCDRFFILESTIPPRMPIIHNGNFSKMGISLLSSYCSAQITDVYGLRKKMIDLVFYGSFSKIDSRYSNCRAVGVLLLSPQHDSSVLEKSLEVTSSIGDHFHSAHFEKNINVLMVLLGVWNVSFFGYLYFQVMEKFISTIQHVNRESTYEGMPIDGVSFPYETIPCDFIVTSMEVGLEQPRPSKGRGFCMEGNPQSDSHKNKDAKKGLFQPIVWNFSFFCNIWSFWLYRNDVIFKSSSAKSEHLFELVITRLSFWCEAKWPVFQWSTTDLVACPLHFGTVKTSTTRASTNSRCPPPPGALKFNTDGAVAGSFGSTGIGGCLRNDHSNCMLYFSKNVGTVDPTTAEILAIRDACYLYDKLVWSKTKRLILESDSKLVVKWITKQNLCPEVFKPLIVSCLTACNGLKWCIQFVNREGNRMADSLAKQGISRTKDLYVFPKTRVEVI
ncbi:hypothetical protein GQ457_16G015060 [Hibiscus cannabinus]